MEAGIDGDAKYQEVVKRYILSKLNVMLGETCWTQFSGLIICKQAKMRRDSTRAEWSEAREKY